MSNLEQRLAALEQELQQLRHREAIKDLRHTYWYSILDKDVERLVSCFAEDAELEYGFDIVLKGKPAIHAFFVQLLGSDNLLRQIPSGSNPLLEIGNDGTARGRWMVQVGSLPVHEGPARRIQVQYFEEYRLQADGWKLSRMKNDYLYFEKPPLETEMT